MANGTSERYSSTVGKKFGKLTVVELDHRKNYKPYWKCLCECGNTTIVRQDHLFAGKIVSCGCYSRDMSRNALKTHGLSKTRLHGIWKNMRNRCRYASHIEYYRYGGRGIKVCDEWQEFMPFYEWAMTHGYRDDLSIDRIDNNGNYEPSNCRWATSKEQSLNRSTNVLISYNGTTKHISEWDKDIGAKKSGRVRARLNAGWSVERAVTTPVWHGRISL